jgi:hypothetical protein
MVVVIWLFVSLVVLDTIGRIGGWKIHEVCYGCLVGCFS